jgi:excisionase family DNA binding protein
MHGPDKLRALTESAKVHGFGRSTLAELLRRGDIAFVRLPGGERRIPDSAIRDWIERNSVRGADAA